MSTKIQQFSYNSYQEFLSIREKLRGTGQRDVFRLGASDIGLVLGLNEWRSTIATFYEHCEHVPSRFLQTLDTQRGHIQEAVAYEYYWKYMDPENPDPEAYLKNYWGDRKIFRTAKKSNTIYLNADHDWVFASPDYEIHENSYRDGRGNLEIKCPRGFVASKYEAGVQAEYVAQVQFQLFVGGFDYGELLSFEDATTPNLFFFELMPENKERMLDLTHEYVKSVLAGKKIVYSNMNGFEKEQALAELAPEETNYPKYNDFLKWHHKIENAKEEVSGTEEQLQTVCEYLREKEHEKKIERLECEIREFFTGNIGRINFGENIGAIGWRQKLSIPKSILKNVEAYG